MTTTIYETEDLAAIRSQTRRFVEEKVVGRGDAWEQAGEVPRHLMEEMGKIGFFGLRVPEEYGGIGMGELASVVFAEELGRGTYGGFTATAIVHTDLAMPYLIQKQSLKEPLTKCIYLHIQIYEVLMSSKKLTSNDITRDCIGVRIRLANRVISRTYDAALRPVGLRITQLAMLAIADQRGLLRQADLCDELQIDDSTLSRNLERMQSNGWLAQSPSDDGRENRYRLTSKGKRLLEKALPRWDQAQHEVAEMLGKAGVKAIHDFAKRQVSTS